MVIYPWTNGDWVLYNNALEAGKDKHMIWEGKSREKAAST